MASAVYPLWLKSIADVWMNLASANPAGSLRVAAVSSAYSFDTGDEFYSDLSGVLGTATISGGSITTTGGVIDADDALIASLSAGEIVAVVLHWWTGSAATSRLMIYFDTFDITPSGQVLVKWSNLSSVGIFPLGGLPS